MAYGLNSYLYQLTYGNIGFILYVVSLKVAVSKNILMTLREDWLYSSCKQTPNLPGSEESP